MDEKIERIRMVQEYIEAHLTEKMSIADLAAEAGYSPWHFSRIFCDVTGRTVFEYIRIRRLSEAVLGIHKGEVRIVDIAMNSGFDSHEGFSRAFVREFGVTPMQYRYDKSPVRLFRPYGINLVYRIHHKEGGNIMDSKNRKVFVQIIEKPKRKVLLKWGKQAREYFEYCEEEGCNRVWEILCGVRDPLFEPVGLWFPEHLRPVGTSEYVHGVELPLDYELLEIPEGFDVITLPAATYLAFQGETYEKDEEFGEAVGEVRAFMETYDCKKFGYRYAFETAPRFQTAPIPSRGYIEGYPVVKI